MMSSNESEGSDDDDEASLGQADINDAAMQHVFSKPSNIQPHTVKNKKSSSVSNRQPGFGLKAK